MPPHSLHALPPSHINVCVAIARVLTSCVGVLQDTTFYLAVCCDGCTPISRARIKQAQEDCEKVVAMQDSAGRKLEVRIKVYVDLNNDTVISVHPQMVIVNRCGVPLRYGRGKLLDSASPAAISAEGGHGHLSANGLYIEEAASQEMVPREGLLKPGDGESANWNKAKPQVVMFSLPEGPEWSPCVCLSGSDSWVRISRAVFGVKEEEEEEEEEEKSTAMNALQTSVSKETPFADLALNLVSHIQLQLDASDEGSADLGGAQRAVELAVEMHVGSGSFHSCVYMEIMPDITVINNTAHVLEFSRTRQGNAGGGHGASLISSLQVAPGEQLPYHGIFSTQSGHGPQSCGYSVSLLEGTGAGGRNCVLASLPFRIAEERAFPLSLWSEDGQKSKLDVLVKRWSGATFVSFSEVQEQQPWYQVKNRSAHHHVHIVQRSNQQTDIKHALAVAPGQSVALSWDNPEAPRLIYAFASASLDDWTNRECGAAALPVGSHRGIIDMDRLGELVTVLALPDWQKAREHRNEGSAYAAGGMRKHSMKRLLCATTILGHTRVLEFHDETQVCVMIRLRFTMESRIAAANHQYLHVPSNLNVSAKHAGAHACRSLFLLFAASVFVLTLRAACVRRCRTLGAERQQKWPRPRQPTLKQKQRRLARTARHTCWWMRWSSWAD